MFFTYQGYPFLSLKSENKNSCLNVFKSWMKNGAIFRVKEAIMDSRCHLGISEGSYFLLLSPHRSLKDLKMATATDMKGNIVKMDVDFTSTVDERLPQCEAMVKVTYESLCFASLLSKF